MQTKVQNMQKYVGYTKCGEILKPPSGSYQRPYVLKCFHCKEIYLLFEAFIFHIEDHCQSLIAETRANNEYTDESTETQFNAEHMELGDKNVNIKVEDVQNSMQTDPLIFVKPEHFSENYNTALVKEEIKSSSNVNNDVNNVQKISDYKERLPSVEELCGPGSNENLDNCDEDGYQSTDEEIESSSDDLTNEESDDCENMLDKQSKRDMVSSIKLNSFVKKFLKTRVHVMSLIEAYKNQPSLWNKNFPCLRHKEKRQNCLQNIADELNKQHSLSLTWNQIASVVIYLCRTYREDLKGIKETNEEEENYTPAWFFEDLNFLKPFMENNQIAKLDSHMPDLLPNQVIELLRIYKTFPHIWNTDMIEHYCKNKVDAAKKEMLQTLEKTMGIKINENILENYFRTVNNCFTRAKRKKINKDSNKTKSNTNTEDTLLADYYEHMLFLNDHVGSFKCSECKRSFKTPMYLKIHQTNAHGFEPIQCSQCKKPFKSVTAYTNHAKRHMEDLNHECKECGKKFLHSTDLRIHMRNHTGVKPFCCEICGASFRHIQGFTNHHRRHIKNYLHTCEICGKGFYSKDRYNDHMNSHSNTRNEVCNVCGKAFITKRSLQQHVVIHDDIRRYSCKLCGKSFKQKTGVNQHMRTHGIANSEEKTTTKKEQI